jgi:hypothetical protein
VNLRKEDLEAKFCALLDSLTVQPGELELLEVVVRDANSVRARRDAGLKTEAQREISKLHQMREKLVAAYVYEHKLDETTYEAERARLDHRLSQLQRNLPDRPDEYDIDSVISKAKAILTDLNGYWNRLDPAQRPKALRAMFPAGLGCQDGVFGTAEIPWLFYEQSLPATHEEALVDQSRLEPRSTVQH